MGHRRGGAEIHLRPEVQHDCYWTDFPEDQSCETPRQPRNEFMQIQQTVWLVSQTWTFSLDFRKILKYQMSRKSARPVGAELFHTDGQARQS